MNMLIIGATRGVGRELLVHALNQGHDVAVLVRNPDRLDVSHDRLEVCVGDATDPGAVGGAVAGRDAVFVCLGAPALKRTDVRAAGTRAVIDAMAASGVGRVVCLSALGVAESREVLPWYLKYLMLPLYLRRAYADHAVQEASLRDSALDWTVVRPPFLTDGPATGDYAHGFDALDGLDLKISRADVAGFMLAQADTARYSRQAVAVSC